MDVNTHSLLTQTPGAQGLKHHFGRRTCPLNLPPTHTQKYKGAIAYEAHRIQTCVEILR